MKTPLLLADVGDVLSPADVHHVLASGRLPSIRVTPRRIIVTRKALEAFLGLSSNVECAGIPGGNNLGIP